MPESLDLVRSIFADWERGDFVSWAEREMDPAGEWVLTDGPEPTILKGTSAYLAWVHDFLNAWEGFRTGADDYRELDDGRILVLLHTSGGRGKTSGLELGLHGGGGAQVFEIRAGKVARVVT